MGARTEEEVAVGERHDVEEGDEKGRGEDDEGGGGCEGLVDGGRRMGGIVGCVDGGDGAEGAGAGGR